MRAIELRIGNYVKVKELNLDNGEYEWVEQDTTSYVIHALLNGNREGFEPIPLTEEWLKKLKFKYSEERASMSNGFEEWEQNGIYLGPMGNEYFIIDALDQGGINVKIEYVHQLQNLYFALTGEELTIKS